MCCRLIATTACVQFKAIKMKKTRLGILIEDETLAWHMFEPLKLLVDEGIVEVCIAVRRSIKPKSILSNVTEVIPFINQRIFSFLSRTKSDVKGYSIHDLVAHGKIPIIISTPKQYQSTDEIEDSVIEKLGAADLDYLLNIGFQNLTEKVLGITKKGILSFHYGDETIKRGEPALYWQFAERWDHSVVSLHLLRDSLDGDKVVGRGYCTLFYLNYNLTEHKLNGVLASILYLYFHNNNIGVESEKFADSIDDCTNYKTTKYLTAIRHLTGYLKYYAVEIFYKISYLSQWSIFIGSVDQSIQTYTELLPEKGCFWADPFYIEQDSRRYIFFESLNYKENIGRIEWVELNESNQVIDSGPTNLGISVHLSFPNVFKYNNVIYMIPEAAETNCINLLKATNFPHKWEKVHKLVVGVKALDSAVIKHNGLWYLFTTHGSLSEITAGLELQIYISDKLMSDDWTLHPLAPIKIDVRGSRLAGALFRKNGQLFRTAQDCTIRYGRRIALYLVEDLTPISYKETFVRYIEPNWSTDIDRLHTYNIYDQTVVLDVSRDRFRFTV